MKTENRKRKNLENRLRRLAPKYGLRVEKDRFHADNPEGYLLIEHKPAFDFSGLGFGKMVSPRIDIIFFGWNSKTKRKEFEDILEWLCGNREGKVRGVKSGS